MAQKTPQILMSEAMVAHQAHEEAKSKLAESVKAHAFYQRQIERRQTALAEAETAQRTAAAALEAVLPKAQK